MEYRYPDNPISGNALNLKRLTEHGSYLAQKKWDGWRRPIYFFEDHIEMFSKHEKVARAPFPIELKKQLEALKGKLPANTAFDAEWMGPRVAKHTNGRNWLIFLDLIWFDNEWQGDLPMQARWERMAKVMHSISDIGVNDIEMIENGERDLLASYTASKENPMLEGIVVKDSLGKLHGNFARCQENAGWIKIKWRA